MTKEQIEIAKLILELLQTIVILIAAYWTYRRFFKEAPHRPRIEMDISYDILERDDDKQSIAFRVSATNHGHVDFRFIDLRLRVWGIKQGEALKTKYIDTLTGQTPYTEFPEGKRESHSIIPKKAGYFFVRPAVTQHFSYTTTVPTSWSMVSARASFKYPTTGELHTAEKVFSLMKIKPRA